MTFLSSPAKAILRNLTKHQHKNDVFNVKSDKRFVLLYSVGDYVSEMTLILNDISEFTCESNIEEFDKTPAQERCIQRQLPGFSKKKTNKKNNI